MREWPAVNSLTVLHLDLESALDHYFGFEQQGDDLLVTVKNDDGDVVQQVKLEGVQYSSDGDFISSLLGHQDQSVID